MGSNSSPIGTHANQLLVKTDRFPSNACLHSFRSRWPYAVCVYGTEQTEVMQGCTNLGNTVVLLS